MALEFKPVSQPFDILSVTRFARELLTADFSGSRVLHDMRLELLESIRRFEIAWQVDQDFDLDALLPEVTLGGD